MRRAYVDHRRKLLILWAPKNACTTIARLFYKHIVQGDDGYGGDYERLRINLAKEGWLVRDSEVATLAGQSYFTFFISRNPFERAVSAYVSKFVKRDDKFISSYEDLEPFSKKFYRQCVNLTSVDTGNYRGITFVEYLEAIHQRIGRHRIDEKLDHHFNTQVSPQFFENEYSLNCFDISRLSEGIELLNKKFDLRMETSLRLNASSYTPEHTFFLGDMSSLDLAKEGVTPDVASLKSSSTLEVARLAYARDYEFFGYE